MPISRPVDQHNLRFIPDQSSIECIHYTYPVVLDSNFYINNPQQVGAPIQVASRIINAIVDLTQDTTITYLSQNGETLTLTLTHNGWFPLHCWGIFTAGAGVLTLEWGR
jgi:hypothetical protein